VAGGGVFGAVVAIALARRGMSVTIADPRGLGENASGVAAGMLAPVFESLLDPCTPDLALLREARDLWPDLAAFLGLTIDKAGAMAVGDPGMTAQWMTDAKSLGISMRRLSEAAASDKSPWLGSADAAIWTPEDWRIDPRNALWAIRERAQGLRINWVKSSVEGFTPGRAFLSDRGELDCDTLVIATGNSHSLLDTAPELASISPIKGHILRFPGLLFEGPVVRGAGVYICPTLRGAVVGSTMEPGLDDLTVDPVAVNKIRQAAGRTAHQFISAAFEASTGVRAATPDGLPFVGASGAKDVWLAVGARRNGWLLAPLVARVIAEGLSGSPRSHYAELFDPRRAIALST
jgi:glycine oxidase